MADTEAKVVQYRVMLSKLDSMLRDDELNRLKSFCKDFIRARDRDQISQCVDLFEALEERNKLSPDNLEFLKMALSSSCGGRSDVLDHLQKFEDKYRTCGDRNTQEEDFSDVFDFLENGLDGKYKSFLRRIGIKDAQLDQLHEDHPRNIKEVIHRSLVAWKKDSAEASIGTLVKALRDVKRNDLANKLADGNFQYL
ncbi:uncharacterized protein LOC101861195 [Aplysia californica]|uniref:Uncharacterized protein LOC101861195 n=1 Tax=Aplysia californica TaxID=6500 RepID=A0ABM0JI78_APLCA|nr:uncharacterized protein LOC101861195 [Aplysia californica]